jgi:hypothetical protein
MRRARHERRRPLLFFLWLVFFPFGYASCSTVRRPTELRTALSLSYLDVHFCVQHFLEASTIVYVSVPRLPWDCDRMFERLDA